MVQGLDFDFCLNPDRGLPLPDLTLFLTLPPEVASARAAYGTERYETMEIQRKVREEFKRVKDKVIEIHGEVWEDIDARGSVEEVGRLIWSAIQRKTHTERPDGIGRLWEKVDK